MVLHGENKTKTKTSNLTPLHLQPFNAVEGQESKELVEGGSYDTKPN